ncbi:uncharacterized protein LOC112091263 isoform X2 [Morus notabilis]|uniref:uncharacterized protein LOC112091263 isoform X2 n=1 Tax=Morus notabilis TaxID=981085 RepID=UPI000CED37E5|nr:uncharacterized protein LOC112091263 isoform X2 [Morus notabilis]
MGSQTHLVGDRSRTTWTPAMERYFIDLMLDQVHRGNRMGHTFNKQAWNDMLVMFNSSFRSPYDVNVLKSHYTSLWKQFSDVKNLLDQNGFSWDSTRKMVVAERCVWDGYTKAHPDAQYYRNKALLNFNDLCLIYAHTTADGRYSLSSHDIDFDDDFQSLNVVLEVNNLVPATNEQVKTDWTLAMDRYFIKLLLGQLRKGSKVNDTFTRQAWKDILTSFNAKFGFQYGIKILRQRYKKLFKYYTNVRSLLEENKFIWDERQQRIVADDVVWENYIKAHPDARSYRKKSLLNYHDLSLIYGTAMSNGVRCHLQRGKDYEDDVLQYTTERERHSFAVDSHIAHSEDFDGEDPDLMIDGEEIQSVVNGEINWTPSMDRCLIDIMLEQVHKMNKIDCSIDDQAWIDMVALFKDRFGLQHDKDVLRSRAKRLEKQYLDMKDLLDQRGFWWDEMEQMITACDDVWDTYIEDHPGAELYRFRSNPNYNDLCLIYGSSASNGQFSQSGRYISCNGGGANVYNNHRWRTDWTPQMDRHFIDLMLEQVRNGSMANHKFNKLAWTDMVTKFSAEFGSQHDKDVLKSRFLNLRKRFNDMKALLDQSGFAWDEMQQRITADDELWDAYVKEYPDARSYRNRTFPNFNDLFLIYGNTNNIKEEDYSSHSIASEDDDVEVNIVSGEADDQSPAYFNPPREHSQAIPYEDGIMDSYEELLTSFGYEVPNGRENLNIKREVENDALKVGMDDIFCDLKSPAKEFEISDWRKKRKPTTSSRSARSKKVQRTIEEREETFDVKPGLANWLVGCLEGNDNCSIETIVAALETVPDMNDELFLEACELLEDERKAKMFVAMDVTARKKWLLRKLRW